MKMTAEHNSYYSQLSQNQQKKVGWFCRHSSWNHFRRFYVHTVSNPLRCPERLRSDPARFVPMYRKDKTAFLRVIALINSLSIKILNAYVNIISVRVCMCVFVRVCARVYMFMCMCMCMCMCVARSPGKRSPEPTCGWYGGTFSARLPGICVYFSK
jgi:hypothetical protein